MYRRGGGSSHDGFAEVVRGGKYIKKRKEDGDGGRWS
jgi:hypothetical protein